MPLSGGRPTSLQSHFAVVIPILCDPQYAHEGCIQRWINEKGNKTCEICHGPFRDSFADPPPPDPSRNRTIPISILPHMLAIRRSQSVRLSVHLASRTLGTI